MRSFWIALSLLVLTQPGCMVWKRMKAAAYDPADNTMKKSDGEYDYIRKNFRGAMEYENDPTKRLLFSEKSLEIERSLGIGE